MSLRHASAFAVCLPAMAVLHECFHMLFLKATGGEGYIAWTSMCVVATSNVTPLQSLVVALSGGLSTSAVFLALELSKLCGNPACKFWLRLCWVHQLIYGLAEGAWAAGLIGSSLLEAALYASFLTGAITGRSFLHEAQLAEG